MGPTRSASEPSSVPLFAAIGEILIDFTPVLEDGRTVGFRQHAGGSPLNVAVALARLGAKVEFVGKVSTDVFGRYLLARLASERVGTRFVAHADAPTTLAFVTLEDGDPAFSFYGERAADTLLRPDDLPEDIAAADFLHCGSISLLREPGASAIAGFVERSRGGPLVSLDPNIRPALVADPDAYRTLLHRLLCAVELVKLSQADLRWLAPGLSLENAASQLLETGPRLLVVTLGGEGCYALSRHGELRLRGLRVEVVDTVGAGDAFTGGLLFRLATLGVTSREALETIDRSGLEEALRFALVAASLTCTRSGADPPNKEEVSRLSGPSSQL